MSEPRPLPPRHVDLTEDEIAQLQLRKLGKPVGVIAPQEQLRRNGLTLDRDVVLLRSFRNV